jgi:hypothetical protein
LRTFHDPYLYQNEPNQPSGFGYEQSPFFNPAEWGLPVLRTGDRVYGQELDNEIEDYDEYSDDGVVWDDDEGSGEEERAQMSSFDNRKRFGNRKEGQAEQEMLSNPGAMQSADPQQQPRPRTKTGSRRTAPSLVPAVGKHNCFICHDNFHTPSSLKRHDITFHSEEAFPCERCNLTIKSLALFKEHMDAYHKGFERKQCRALDCHHVSYDKQTAREHRDNIHGVNDGSATRAYVCEECTNAFMTERQLNRHIKSRHTADNKKFGCPAEGCPQKCERKENMQRHILKCHKGLPAPL